MKDINCWDNKFKSCVYSDKLLSKILVLNKTLENKINIVEIKKAIYYAKKYHGNQKRQSGEPFYSHPLKVAEMVSEYYPETTILVTSILHDTIEDTKLTKEMINFIFGTIIANNVDSLTRVKADKKISSIEIIENLWVNKKIELLLIKLLDRVHNIQTISAKPPERIKQIAEETTKQFISLSMYLNSVLPKINIENKIANLCYTHLSINKIQQSELEISLNLNDNFELPLPIE